MHIALVAAICFVLRIVFLRNVVFTAADVVGRGENVIIQIVSLVIVFLRGNKKILQLF